MNITEDFAEERRAKMAGDYSAEYAQDCRETADRINTDIAEITALVSAKLRGWARDGLLDRNVLRQQTTDQFGKRVWVRVVAGPEEASDYYAAMVDETLRDARAPSAAEMMRHAEGA